MSVTKETAIALAELYRKRESLQRHRERATSRNLWLGFITRGQAPVETTSGPTRGMTDSEMIVDALGGTGEVASLLLRAMTEQFEKLQRDIDKQIDDLGGEV